MRSAAVRSRAGEPDESGDELPGDEEPGEELPPGDDVVVAPVPGDGVIEPVANA